MIKCIKEVDAQLPHDMICIFFYLFIQRAVDLRLESIQADTGREVVGYSHDHHQ